MFIQSIVVKTLHTIVLRTPSVCMTTTRRAGCVDAPAVSAVTVLTTARIPAKVQLVDEHSLMVLEHTDVIWWLKIVL